MKNQTKNKKNENAFWEILNIFLILKLKEIAWVLGIIFGSFLVLYILGWGMGWLFFNHDCSGYETAKIKINPLCNFYDALFIGMIALIPISVVGLLLFKWFQDNWETAKEKYWDKINEERKEAKTWQ
jgi:hypothetical protein